MRLSCLMLMLAVIVWAAPTGFAEPAHDHDHDHDHAHEHDHSHEHQPTEEAQDDHAHEHAAQADATGEAAHQHAVAIEDSRVRFDVGLDLLFSAGASTASNEEMETLQGGAHDPNKRGFTLQQAELSLRAQILSKDSSIPDLFGQAYLVMREDVVEMEEAYISMVWAELGLRADAGVMLTNIGLSNALHPHAWNWLDQPITLTRFFGGEGMGGAGARVRWSSDYERFSFELGLQDAYGDRMTSFGGGFGAHAHDHEEEEGEALGVGGRLLVEREVHSFNDFVSSFRIGTRQEFDAQQDLLASATLLLGPNATALDGQSIVVGAGVRYRWGEALQNSHELALIELGLEAFYRSYDAGEGLDEGDDPLDPADDTLFPESTFEDYGVTIDLGVRVAKRWQVGARAEYLSGNNRQSFDHDSESFIAREDDPARADRYRFSLRTTWWMAEDARVVLQYNYDVLETLEDEDAHGLWLGVDVFFGTGQHTHE